MGREPPPPPVGALKAIAVVVALAAAGAIAGVLVIGGSTSVPAIAPTAPIVVRASFDPPASAFGDRIYARVVVALDASVVAPQTLRFSDDLAPLTQLAAPQTQRVASGTLELTTVVVEVACLTAPCAARNGVTHLVLPHVRASVSERNGTVVSASSAWPTLEVRGRVLTSDLAAATPPFQADTTPPPLTYRWAPATFATVLDGLAALFALAAVGIGASQALGRARRRRPAAADALERALRLAREAETLPAPDRRRALDLLARLLGRDGLSRTASQLAWSEPEPESDEVEELVSEIERGRSA
jgi:hypothetical protein